jgi:hypothetical protein
VQIIQSEIAQFSPDPRLGERCWSLIPILARPRSRGAVRLTGTDPSDPIAIDGEFLAHAGNLRALRRGFELCQETGNSMDPGLYRKADDGLAALMSHSRSVPDGRGLPVRILVVGDDSSLLHMVGNYLEEHAMRVLFIAEQQKVTCQLAQQALLNAAAMR